MFDLPIDDRLSSWANLRALVNTTHDPYGLVLEFWHSAPFVPYNRNINPHNQKSWPTPWEIIVENQYDDFTKALMMAYTLKFTEKFTNSKIDIRICLDKEKTVYYNIVCVDDSIALNYQDFEETSWHSVPRSFLVENIIEIDSLR
jgi:hypothetical protein